MGQNMTKARTMAAIQAILPLESSQCSARASQPIGAVEAVRPSEASVVICGVLLLWINDVNVFHINKLVCLASYRKGDVNVFYIMGGKPLITQQKTLTALRR